jgi:hypothetical protein
MLGPVRRIKPYISPSNRRVLSDEATGIALIRIRRRRTASSPISISLVFLIFFQVRSRTCVIRRTRK